MGQNLQMGLTASQSGSHPIPQGYSHQLAGLPNSQRQDWPSPGAAGNSCYMCNETAHFLNSCPILLGYTWIGKAARNMQNKDMLGHREPILSYPTNHPWVTQIDKYYARNPHLLPWETIQANFSANLLEVHNWGSTKEKNSSLLSHLESINKEDEVLSSLRGKENPEEAKLGRYMEVLQARKNEMALG